MAVKRIGQVIGIKPEDIQEYENLHANAWPSIIKIIKQANISNYSIFRYRNLLFAYLEYTGADYEADMAKLAVSLRCKDGGRLPIKCNGKSRRPR